MAYDQYLLKKRSVKTFFFLLGLAKTATGEQKRKKKRKYLEDKLRCSSITQSVCPLKKFRFSGLKIWIQDLHRLTEAWISTHQCFHRNAVHWYWTSWCYWLVLWCNSESCSLIQERSSLDIALQLFSTDNLFQGPLTPLEAFSMILKTEIIQKC